VISLSTRPCLEEYRRYADTAAVSAALYSLFKEESPRGKFAGIDHKFRDIRGNPLTPDFAALSQDKSTGMVFELKSSLPSDEELLTKEMKEIEKYSLIARGWPTATGSVDHHDIVLVCHMDDAKKAVETAERLSKENDSGFFAREGFTIWSWVLSSQKEPGRKDEMRLMKAYGATRNEELEGMISSTGGILISEKVLEVYRFQYLFVRARPPVQYTIVMLIQHVLNPILSSYVGSGEREIPLELVLARVGSFFPHWWGSGADIAQTKKDWILEALQKMVEIDLMKTAEDKGDVFIMYTPSRRYRDSLNDVVCKKLLELTTKTKPTTSKMRSLRNYV